MPDSLQLPLSGVRVLLERTDEARPESVVLEATGGRVAEAYVNVATRLAERDLPGAAAWLTAQSGGALDYKAAGLFMPAITALPFAEAARCAALFRTELMYSRSEAVQRLSVKISGSVTLPSRRSA